MQFCHQYRQHPDFVRLCSSLLQSFFLGQEEGFDDGSNEPVLQPLKTLEDVNSWYPGCDELGVATVPLATRLPRDGPKTLVCHDMAGGYLEDRFLQGCKKGEFYRFYHWQYVDTFVYFSHYFITIPPPCWTNAAHKHGVRLLGTIITEWDDGFARCKEFLKSEESYKALVNKLVELAVYYRFDGWLVNIENKIDADQVENLRLFVDHLTGEMHQRLPGSEVIWYDSVINTGELKWQDMLNEHNEQFFGVSDGIFLNYCWNNEKLENSASKASQAGRSHDVYVGIDVFGRGCPGGGGYNTIEAMTAARQHGLSAAIFAQGWTYERQGKENFTENENKFWSLLERKCYIHPVTSLPLCTSFCQGWGQKYYVYGKVKDDALWWNMCLQQVQPSYSSAQFEDNEDKAYSMEAYTAEAYLGGASLKLSGKLSKNKATTYKLFALDHDMKTYKKPTKLVMVWAYKFLSDKQDGVLYLTLTIKQGDTEVVHHLCPQGTSPVTSNIEGSAQKVVTCGPVDVQGELRFTDLNADIVQSGWTVCYALVDDISDTRLKSVCAVVSSPSGEEGQKVAVLLGQLQIYPEEALPMSLPEVRVTTVSFDQDTHTQKVGLTSSCPQPDNVDQNTSDQFQHDKPHVFSFTIEWTCDGEADVDYYNIYQVKGQDFQLLGHSVHPCFRVNNIESKSSSGTGGEEKVSEATGDKNESLIQVLVQPVLKLGIAADLNSYTPYSISIPS